MDCRSPIETQVAWLKVLKLFGPKIIFKIYIGPFSKLGLLAVTFLWLIMLLRIMNVVKTKESVNNQPNIVRIYFSWTLEPNSPFKLESLFIVIQTLLLKLLHHFWSPQCMLPSTYLYFIQSFYILFSLIFLLFSLLLLFCILGYLNFHFILILFGKQ